MFTKTEVIFNIRCDAGKKYYMTDRRMLKLLEYVDGVSYQELYTPDYVRELLNSSEIQILTPIDKILDRLLKLDDKVQKVLGDVPSPSVPKPSDWRC